MSTEIVNTNTNADAKVKKITLAGKYAKFMVFGHWLIQRLNADETVAAAARDTLLMFASPEEQNLMFDLFFNDLKTSTAEMKALVKQHNKPAPKPKKEKAVTEKKPKGKKKPTELITDPQDALVAEIVAAAQTEIAPGAELRTVLRKGEPTVPHTPLPSAEEVVVALAEEEVPLVAAKEQPAKKKVVKKAAKAEKPVEVVASVVGEEPVKKTDKTDKAAEKQAKEDAKAAEKKAKDDAKAAEKQAKDDAKAAEKKAKDDAKAAEKKAKDDAKAAEKKAKDDAKKDKDVKPHDHEEGSGERGSPDGSTEDDTLNLRPISFPDGKTFLLDEANNDLYDPSSINNDDFAPVATYRGNQWFPLTPSLV
jgi:hypothetical protein